MEESYKKGVEAVWEMVAGMSAEIPAGYASKVTQAANELSSRSPASAGTRYDRTDGR